MNRRKGQLSRILRQLIQTMQPSSPRPWKGSEDWFQRTTSLDGGGPPLVAAVAARSYRAAGGDVAQICARSGARHRCFAFENAASRAGSVSEPTGTAETI